NQVLYSRNNSIDKISGYSDEPFRRTVRADADFGSSLQSLNTTGEKGYKVSPSNQNFQIEKNSYTSFHYTRDSAIPSYSEFTPTTGSIGEQPSEDPTVSSEEPLPPVTVPRTVPSAVKASKIKQSVDVKRNRGKSFPTKITPASTKKKNFPSTEKTLFYLFN
ncbi:MAG: hypothetical protein ACKOW3_07360, partial [Hyphomicrobium sp.]